MNITPFEPHKSARFPEIMRRRLYRKLGYSSIIHFARAELKFSKTRTGDFVQLARNLEQFPP